MEKCNSRVPFMEKLKFMGVILLAAVGSYVSMTGSLLMADFRAPGEALLARGLLAPAGGMFNYEYSLIINMKIVNFQHLKWPRCTYFNRQCPRHGLVC